MTPKVTDQVTPQVARVLGAARSDCSFADLQAAAGLKDRVHFLKTHMEPLLLAVWIERTISDKPRSSKQKYRLTENGRKVLHEQTGGGR
jgi:ATP-dependent DNA helicase RecG